jgi:hypothetical protein
MKIQHQLQKLRAQLNNVILQEQYKKIVSNGAKTKKNLQ